ncbi:class I SAM-dependent methyltransferase [Mangrovihabitans endophyticus]|uniref:Methyltransferase n=1 Tax=Mangrovihabitans endophyticus TaxID=1751298 RepID=A0A8J3C1U9_9ACTN|nr:SAM-dependent methyltransferase [Mangrovihabitans endophyticus]GGK96311.1 methyltransferase [Mangrovihabitans endophyticus]
MPEPLDTALAQVRDLLLAPDLRRAVAAGRQRGAAPSMGRAEVRPVAVKGGTRLQIVTDDGSRPYTRNVAYGAEAARAVDALLTEPFGNWHVQTTALTMQVRVTKKGDAQVHRSAADGHLVADGPAPGHDRVKQWLLDPGDPLFTVLGGTAAKRRQVDAFLRALAATLPGDPQHLPSPLHVVDLGCGNAYLTFAAYRYLRDRGIKARVVGVDVRADQRARNADIARRLGCADEVTFVAGSIDDAVVDPTPELVLALHACDTATDQALARAVRWGARWVLAAPCCHHDIAAQLKRGSAPEAYGEMTRHAILRERFADVLTDTLRASLLRQHGYRVDVVEFTDSAHTPRNLLLRARHTGQRGDPADYDALTTAWGVTPALALMIAPATTAAPPAAGDPTAENPRADQTPATS